MQSPLFQSIYLFKKYLDKKNILVHWQYLLLASILSVFGGVLWSYISIRFQLELGIVVAIIGIIQGLLAFLFMKEKGEPRLILYALLFSLISFFLGKYLIYVHYYDWVLSGAIDKSNLSISLLIFYIQAIDYGSIRDFFIFFSENISLYDILWITILVATSMEYKLLFPSRKDSSSNKQKPGSGRRISRRFTGQNH